MKASTGNQASHCSTEASNSLRDRKLIPKRPFGSTLNNDKLPASISMVGLGCSSFSTFFWSDDAENNEFTVESLNRHHETVQEWIATIVHAIDCGITLLDTAPWYGHGTSEVVIGWALEELEKDESFDRSQIMINTKVGRYEAVPRLQFDFSRTKTLVSVQTSCQRLGTTIDVLQVHDPEFAPSLDVLLKETIPAMTECQKRGQCRALGMTGYPLAVQHFLLEQSLQEFGTNVWDQAMTYSHFNLHDTSLWTKPIGASKESFGNYCTSQGLALLAAAPLSMGLLTQQGPPEWHPAGIELQDACRQAAIICHGRFQVDIATLALCVALSEPRIACTILGMKNVAQVDAVHAVTLRFVGIDTSQSQDAILKQVLTDAEYQAWEVLRDPVSGPFATVWFKGNFRWDGVQEARAFWKQVPEVEVTDWQPTG